MTLVLSQAIHLATCRTRRVSLFTQGLFSNPVVLYAVVIEVGNWMRIRELNIV
jgi:predicted DNA-binding transcriptional regulator